jgi:Family of unknown function (DUF5996)
MLARIPARIRRERELARYPVQSMARNLLGASFVLSDRRQVSACTDTLGQSFLARDLLRQFTRTNDVPDSGRVWHRNHVRSHPSRGDRGGSRRAQGEIALGPMCVAEFHSQFRELIGRLGGVPEFDGRPNEVPHPIPFRHDWQKRPYDAAAVTRFFQALVSINRIFHRFRTGFLGKVSPVHLFWGSFDLAVTCFSGRAAPHHRAAFRACRTR